MVDLLIDEGCVASFPDGGAAYLESVGLEGLFVHLCAHV